MTVKSIDAIIGEMQRVQSDALKRNTLEWYLKQIKELFKNVTTEDDTKAKSDKPSAKGNVDENDIKRNIVQTVSSFNYDILGRMILFRYDPKLKMTLPYYDTFPLVIPFTPGSGGKVDTSNSILGLNLHYLPPPERLKLLTALGTLINNTKNLTEKSRLTMTYKFLKGASRFREFRPCIKRYLTDHVKSRVFVINPQEWSRVINLPLARWQKGSEYTVWADSLKMIRKRQN